MFCSVRGGGFLGGGGVIACSETRVLTVVKEKPEAITLWEATCDLCTCGGLLLYNAFA
jgi:hypothetical protein